MFIRVELFFCVCVFVNLFFLICSLHYLIQEQHLRIFYLLQICIERLCEGLRRVWFPCAVVQKHSETGFIIGVEFDKQDSSIRLCWVIYWKPVVLSLRFGWASVLHFVASVNFSTSTEVIKLLLDASAFHLSCCILLTVYSKTCSFYSSYFFALQ